MPPKMPPCMPEKRSNWKVVKHARLRRRGVDRIGDRSEQLDEAIELVGVGAPLGVDLDAEAEERWPMPRGEALGGSHVPVEGGVVDGSEQAPVSTSRHHRDRQGIEAVLRGQGVDDRGPGATARLPTRRCR